MSFLGRKKTLSRKKKEVKKKRTTKRKAVENHAQQSLATKKEQMKTIRALYVPQAPTMHPTQRNKCMPDQQNEQDTKKQRPTIIILTVVLVLIEYNNTKSLF